MKHCAGCGVDKPLEEFSDSKRGKFGKAFYCRPCAAAQRRAYYARTSSPEQRAAAAVRQSAWLAQDPERRERDRLASLEWAKRNPQSVNARNARWRRRHPDRVREIGRKYRGSHPEQGRIDVERRRARLAAAPVNDLTTQDWSEVLEAFQYRCAYCLASDPRLQMDHLEPLSKGGSHTKSNIVPACQECNMRKSTKSLLTFATVA